jgi:hypothetical protein
MDSTPKGFRDRSAHPAGTGYWETGQSRTMAFRVGHRRCAPWSRSLAATEPNNLFSRALFHPGFCKTLAVSASRIAGISTCTAAL